MEEAESADRRPPEAVLEGTGAAPTRTEVRGGRRLMALSDALRFGSEGRIGALYVNPLDAAAWVALYAFAFRLIVSVHLSAMPGAQLADLAAPSGGLFSAVWSCHEFDGQNNKSPADPLKKGRAGDSCTLCAAVSGSAAMPGEGLALPKPQYTSFSLIPAVSIRPAGSEYFHARPRGPPALSA
jgi:hypothetical protein